MSTNVHKNRLIEDHYVKIVVTRTLEMKIDRSNYHFF